MTWLDALAGGVLVAGFDGTEIPESLRKRASQGQLGGVILFKRNLPDLETTATLLADLASLFPEPPMLAVDQEGGRVARLGPPVLSLPPMRALGAIDDPSLTERAARVLGWQLAALGFTCDFAPVLDVDTNPANPVIGDRSFGRTPAVVTRHGIAFARGLGSAGILACGKHFPGHGDTELDSHHALPRLGHDRARLDRVELAPFRAARGAIPSLMTAHVVFDALDATVPATLSRRVVTDLLKGELGYDGLVVSDDLEMKAVRTGWGIATSACEAIAAGCDTLLVCSELGALDEAHDALVGRAAADDAFAERLADAAARTLAVRRDHPTRSSIDGAERVRELAVREGAPIEAEIADRHAQVASTE